MTHREQSETPSQMALTADEESEPSTSHD